MVYTASVKELRVSDQPEVLAEALIRLLRDDDAWLRQSAAQSVYAEARFSRAALRESLLGAFGNARRSLAA
jgi:hypothetical protein